MLALVVDRAESCYARVVHRSGPDAKFTAELITFLARFGLGLGCNHGLTGAQWAALRFFSHAVHTSRTISAFADYHLTTRGTASQTVKSLVTKQLLKRMRLQSDSRIIQIDLTPEGSCLCEKDPFAEMARTIAGMPEAEQAALRTTLESLMCRIAKDNHQRSFGPCSTCQYLRKSIGLEDKETVYFCRFMSEPLRLPELDTICMDYKADATRV